MTRCQERGNRRSPSINEGIIAKMFSGVKAFREAGKREKPFEGTALGLGVVSHITDLVIPRRFTRQSLLFCPLTT